MAMKRTVTFLVVGALILTLTAGVALAANFTCDKETPLICEGTSSADTIYGNSKANTIYGKGGNDTITGRGGGDDLYGNNGNDTVRGGKGNDKLNGGAGKDTLYDRAGENDTDELNGGDSNDYLNAADGDANDTVRGGSGTDKCVIDVIFEDEDKTIEIGRDTTASCESVQVVKSTLATASSVADPTE